ncbi:hypothetical protein [Stenotrophomonas indicatrix]|uniref:hypothetical protein n=1 Tax=Stenotrophomonas indicatrix TaxID=2045451 RepID=UPI0007395813|nr:hypothetical protein [Stenotrophomonas indicatrix]CRD54395.1 conserved hypothetical protein [Stenotrophomonas indicatrix]
MRNQLDIFDHDPARMAAANRAAADHALHDRQFIESDRQERAAYYTREAERWEFSAALGGRQINGAQEPLA